VALSPPRLDVKVRARVSLEYRMTTAPVCWVPCATELSAVGIKSRGAKVTFAALWEKELPRLPGKSKLAEAIRHATSRRVALERFLSDGRFEIDSNIVERAIRPGASGAETS
jgi:Transposase IS66 family